MRRRLSKNRVRLRLREGGAPRGLGDSSHVVAGVVIEGGKHLIRADAHVGEELDAVGDAALLVRHHAIEETVRSLARRHGGEVGPAHAGWRAEWVGAACAIPASEPALWGGSGGYPS